jgi:hypothetical protein
MSRGIIRKPSFWKIVGAYRSQWKRMLKRMFIYGYGQKGMGWWRDPKKSWYNWWYHRTSISIYRIFGSKPSRGLSLIAMTVAAFASVFAFPVDAVKAGSKAHKFKKARKAHTERAEARKSREEAEKQERRNNQCTNTKPTRPTSLSGTNKVAPKKSASTSKAHPVTVKVKTCEPYIKSISFKDEEQEWAPPASEEPEVLTELDENMPKSKPKAECDQYIRKRMMIAGLFYCNQTGISRLSVGTYFDMIAEPNNPHDKNAVALFFANTKIGYVARNDAPPFATSLKLGRAIYGVVTDIREADGKREIEYEAWFSRKNN